MKYNNTADILNTIVTAIFDPTSITNNFTKSETLKYSKGLESNNSMNNNIYAEPENSNIEYNKTVPTDDNNPYNNNNSESNSYYNRQQNTSSNPQGVIDSIAQELTSARLQQAIILSEIVGKPKSKTRQKRRF